MIDIIEKDGATIITVENPTVSEMVVIQKAKNAYQFANSNVWSKFKCNQKTNNIKINRDFENAVKRNEQELNNVTFEGFEVIGDDDLPF